MIEVDGRTRNADVDSSGRFRYEYQLRSGITIGEEHDVIVTFDGGAGGDIEEETSFSVTEAELGVMPAAGGPRPEHLRRNSKECLPTRWWSEIRIDGANRLGGRNVNTDRDGRRHRLRHPGSVPGSRLLPRGSACRRRNPRRTAGSPG